MIVIKVQLMEMSFVCSIEIYCSNNTNDVIKQKTIKKSRKFRLRKYRIKKSVHSNVFLFVFFQLPYDERIGNLSFSWHLWFLSDSSHSQVAKSLLSSFFFSMFSSSIHFQPFFFKVIFVLPLINPCFTPIYLTYVHTKCKHLLNLFSKSIFLDRYTDLQ